MAGVCTGLQRPVRCLKLQVISRQRATNYRALLRKMTYEDTASYGSAPPYRDPTNQKRLFNPVTNKNSWGVWCTGWRRPIKCLELQVIFRKRPNNYRALLRKMTCEDKASYGSSPLCRRLLQYYWYHFPVLHILFLKRSSTGTVIGTNWMRKRDSTKEWRVCVCI